MSLEIKEELLSCIIFMFLTSFIQLCSNDFYSIKITNMYKQNLFISD